MVKLILEINSNIKLLSFLGVEIIRSESLLYYKMSDASNYFAIL